MHARKEQRVIRYIQNWIISSRVAHEMLPTSGRRNVTGCAGDRYCQNHRHVPVGTAGDGHNGCFTRVASRAIHEVRCLSRSLGVTPALGDTRRLHHRYGRKPQKSRPGTSKRGVRGNWQPWETVRLVVVDRPSGDGGGGGGGGAANQIRTPPAFSRTVKYLRRGIMCIGRRQCSGPPSCPTSRHS